VAAVVQSTGVAIASMAEVAEGLVVDPQRMRDNIGRTQGLIFAERAMLLLGAELGRDVAHKVLQEAAKKSTAENRTLVSVLRENPQVTACLTPAMLEQLEVPEQYLGSAEDFREALAAEFDPDDRKER
jgi:3-carboxy-cis,cis-muconate cycloisomerase